MENFRQDVSAAAALFLPFVLLFILLLNVAPPTASQLQASDPLVQLVNDYAGLWALGALSAFPALVWIALAPPSGEALLRGARRALAALLTTALGLPLLRLVAGPALPAFIPPEESALPGLALGVGAGILEEATFRLGLLAIAFVAARRFWRWTPATAFAVVVTGLAFALSHELGPGEVAFDPQFFATRFVVPGCIMSSLFFRPGPAFLVTLHCSAHIGIALLFTGIAGSAGAQ